MHDKSTSKWNRRSYVQTHVENMGTNIVYGAVHLATTCFGQTPN